jgi:hypothetical protein
LDPASKIHQYFFLFLNSKLTIENVSAKSSQDFFIQLLVTYFGQAQKAKNSVTLTRGRGGAGTIVDDGFLESI